MGPRVLHLIYGLEPGGAEIYLLNCARFARATGAFEPQVVGWRKGGPIADQLAAAGVPTRVLLGPGRRAGPRALLAVARALTAQVRRDGIEIIHGHLTDGAALAVLVGKLTGRPSVAHVHSNHVLPVSLRAGSPKRAAWRALMAGAYGAADAVAVISDAVGEAVASEYGAPRTRLAPAPIGVPTPTVTHARAAVRDRLGAAPDALVALFPGRLVSNKNQAALIAMMEPLAAEAPGAELWLAGEGPDRADLLDRVAALGLGARVKLLGRRDDVGDLLNAADVFVSASETEGVSLAVLEAFALRTPVVCADAPGNRDLVADGRGVNAPSDAPIVLADAVRMAVAGRTALTERAFAFWRDHHSLEAAVGALEALYARLLGRDDGTGLKRP